MKIDSLSMGEAAEGLASKKGRIGAVWGKPNHGGVSGEKEWRAAGGAEGLTRPAVMRRKAG